MRGRNKKRRENRERRKKQKQAGDKVAPPPASPVVVQKEEPKMLDPEGSNDAVPKQNEGESHKPARRSITIQDWLAGAIGLFTLVQAIFGGYQWIATRDQYSAMLAQNKIAQGQLEQAAKASTQIEKQLELARVDQRAWLDIEPPTLLPSVVGEWVSYEFRVKNIGKTPAQLVSHLEWAVHGPKDGGKEMEKELLHYSRFLRQEAPVLDHFIAPGASWGLRGLPVDIQHAEAATDTKIKNGDIVIWIFVRVTYLDSSGDYHTTEKWFTSFGAEGMRDLGSHGRMD